MSETVVSSTIEFLEEIKDYGPMMMFRGQSNQKWPLVPSIVRYADTIDGYDDINGLEDHLLHRFQQFGMPFKDFRNLEKLEKLVHAQHYGLPTRLLDWSTNPLKALFFAVEDYNHDSVDGAVYVTSPSSWNEGTSKDINLDDYVAFFPELLHERISAQDACLLSFPLPVNSMTVAPLTSKNLPKHLDCLEKIIIKKEYKIEIRRQLSILGVNHRTVYPGLEGTTKWIKNDLSNFTK